MRAPAATLKGPVLRSRPAKSRPRASSSTSSCLGRMLWASSSLPKQERMAAAPFARLPQRAPHPPRPPAEVCLSAASTACPFYPHWERHSLATAPRLRIWSQPHACRSTRQPQAVWAPSLRPPPPPPPPLRCGAWSRWAGAGSPPAPLVLLLLAAPQLSSSLTGCLLVPATVRRGALTALRCSRATAPSGLSATTPSACTRWPAFPPTPLLAALFPLWRALRPGMHLQGLAWLSSGGRLDNNSTSSCSRSRRSPAFPPFGNSRPISSSGCRSTTRSLRGR